MNLLFLHGLNLPTQADAFNDLVRKQMTAILGKEYSVHTINYSDFLHASQMYRLNLFNTSSQNLKSNWARGKMHPGPWWDIMMILRVLPHRILNLGLSFWGDRAFRNHVFAQVDSQLTQMRMTDNDADETIVLMGFSMGATILLEYLHEYARKATDETVQQQHPLSRAKNVILVTLGSALNWHHPTHPFRFTEECNRAFHRGGFRWINIRFSTDVLASGAWIRDDEQARHVRVHDICLDMSGHEQRQREVPPTIHSDGPGLISLFFHNFFTLILILVQALRFLFVSTRFNLTHGTNVIGAFFSSLLVVLARSTPASHLVYFRDVYVLQTIRNNLLKAMHELSQPIIDINQHAPIKRTKALSTVHEAVTLKPLLQSHITPKTRKKIVFLYVHGMATPAQYHAEWAKVRRGMLEAVTRLRSQGIDKEEVSVDLYGLSYYGVLEESAKRSHRSLYGDLNHELDTVTSPLAMHSQTHASFNRPRRRIRSPLDVYQGLKKVVLTEFPVAMSFWSEEHVRTAILQSFERQLRRLIPSCLHQNQPTDQEAGVVDLHVVLLGYTVGSVVGLWGLSELSKRNPSFDAFVKECLKQDSNQFKHVKVNYSKLERILTYGCTVGWFGNVTDWSKYVPDYFKQTALPLWTNYYYGKDACGMPLVPLKSELARHIHDIRLETFSPLRMRAGESKSKRVPKLFETLSRIKSELVRRAKDLSGIHTFVEIMSSLNGAYLDDERVWSDIHQLLADISK